VVGKVLSGGQTGVDRAALDAAVELGIPYGGWCPAGGWAEDMREPPGLLSRYRELRERASDDPAERTRLNVRDSDATLILTDGAPRSPGTELTRRAAAELGRPLAVVDLAEPEQALALARGFLGSLPSRPALNVAGPRESQAPGIYAQAKALLETLLGPGED
jgi:hypothetical protein